MNSYHQHQQHASGGHIGSSNHQRFATVTGVTPQYQNFMASPSNHNIGLIPLDDSGDIFTQQQHFMPFGNMPLSHRSSQQFPSSGEDQSRIQNQNRRGKQLSTDLAHGVSVGQQSRNSIGQGPGSSGSFQVSRSIAEEFSQQHKVFKAATAKNQVVPRQQMKPSSQQQPYGQAPHHVPKTKSIISNLSSASQQQRNSNACQNHSIYNLSQTTSLRENKRSIESMLPIENNMRQSQQIINNGSRQLDLRQCVRSNSITSQVQLSQSFPMTGSITNSHLLGTPTQNYLNNYYSQVPVSGTSNLNQLILDSNGGILLSSSQNLGPSSQETHSLQFDNRLEVQQLPQIAELPQVVNEGGDQLGSEFSSMRESVQSHDGESSISQSPLYLIRPNFEEIAMERAQRIESLGRIPQASPQIDGIKMVSGQGAPRVYYPVTQSNMNHTGQQNYNIQQPQFQMYPPSQIVTQPILMVPQVAYHSQVQAQLGQYSLYQSQEHANPPLTGSHLQTRSVGNLDANIPQLQTHQGPYLLAQNSNQGTPEQYPNLSVLEHSIIRPQSGIGMTQHSGFLPFVSCTQLQNSHCSSSGNISSSWLSQSQTSQMQGGTPPQGTTNSQQSSPCQCPNCLKAQMVQLQYLIQQQQLFFQQNQIGLSSTPPQKQVVPSQQQHIRQAKILNQATFQQPNSVHNPPSSFNGGTSMLQNQSSSCWISSNSQVSPQSNSQSKILGGGSTAGNRSNPAVGQSSILQSSMATETMQSQGTMQLTTSPKKPRNMRGNEDETQLEERKSETEGEEEDSGSIPDEIDQLRSFNEKGYQEEVTAQMISAQQDQILQLQKDQIETIQLGTNGERNDEGHNMNDPFWNPNQQNQNQSQLNMLRKNYIELPMGEIPEMKESFYDEASRWSQVFAAANQSRNKTPDVMTSLSQQNLHSEKIMNSNLRYQVPSEANQSSQSRQNFEEEKEDLFIYSQGESGATLNRSDNENSFLTSERNKTHSLLQNDYAAQQLKKHDDQPSPSFEALRELSSVNKSLESGQDKSAKLQMQSMIEPQTAQKDSLGASGGHQQMMYPSSTDTKRPPLEYSASSAKYINQSLTLTPSQNGSNDYTESDANINQQKSITKLILRYDHQTPPKCIKREINIPKKELNKDLNNIKASCLILDTDMNSSFQKYNYEMQSMTEEEQIAAAREVLLSPLPPMPFTSAESQSTPDPKSDQNPQVQIISSKMIDRRRIPASSLSHYNSSSLHRHSVSRGDSEQYEKERANKIINYILNSDQKSGGLSSGCHQLMKQSLVKGFHRPHVMSQIQVQSLFPSLEDLLLSELPKQFSKDERDLSGLRQQSLEVKKCEDIIQVEDQNAAPNQIEEVLMWSASLKSDSGLTSSQRVSLTPSVSAFQNTQLSYPSKGQSLPSKVPQDLPGNPQPEVIGKQETQPKKLISAQSKALPQNNIARLIQSAKIKIVEPSSAKKDQVKSQTLTQINNQALNTQKSGGYKTSTQRIAQNYVNSRRFNQAESSLLESSLTKQSLFLKASQRFKSVESDHNNRKGSQGDNTRQQDRSRSNGAVAINKIEQLDFSNGKHPKLEKISPIDKPRLQQVNSSIQILKNQIMSSRSRGRIDEVTLSQNSLSPYYGDKAKFINQISNVAQNKNPLRVDKVSTQGGAKLSSTQIVGKEQKYSPTVFDRLTKTNTSLQQTTRLPFETSQLALMSEDLKHLQFVQNSVATQNVYGINRDTSVKSRPSVERVGGVDTRNSSCSSGAKSGPRKRKFSKIVFEISELPSTSVINRSVSNKRNNDHLGMLRTSIPSSAKGFGSAAFIHRKLESPFGPQRKIADKRQQHISRGQQQNLSGGNHKFSISPIRTDNFILPKTLHQIQPTHSHQITAVLDSKSTNRSYNSSQDFIVTHDNFQIRQLTNEEAALSTTEPNGFSMAMGGYLPTQESQLSVRHTNISSIPNRQENASSHDISTTIVQQSTQKDESSRAIVQQLLHRNENVGQQLQKLFGQRLNSKNSSLISELNAIGEESSYHPPPPSGSSHEKQGVKKSPFNSSLKTIIGRQPPGKVSSPSRIEKAPRITQGNATGNGFNMTQQQLSNQVENNLQQKVCLPNSMFFGNQSQKIVIPKILQGTTGGGGTTIQGAQRSSNRRINIKQTNNR